MQSDIQKYEVNFFLSYIYILGNFYKFFSTNFFLVKIFFIEFFLAKAFPFTKIFLRRFFHNIFANSFCIWCLRNNVFCEIFYLKFCLLRIFLFCNFCVRKKNCKFFLRFFLAMNVNTKFENISFLKKSKVKSSLLTIRKVTVLRDDQRTRKIQNDMKSTTGYLE